MVDGPSGWIRSKGAGGGNVLLPIAGGSLHKADELLLPGS